MIFDVENSLSKSDFGTFWQGRKAKQSIPGRLYEFVKDS